jgi:AcrR family transcriptional regulator
MERARSGILEGARRSIELHGVRGTTMGRMADYGGVAKATVYNHFRTKTEVLVALAADEIEMARRVGTARLASGAPAAEALAAAVSALAEGPALRAVSSGEPDIVAVLAVPGPHPLWGSARAAVTEVIGSSVALTAAAVDLVVRWAASVVLAPPGAADLRSQADAVVAAVQSTSVEADLAADAGRPLVGAAAPG